MEGRKEEGREEGRKEERKEGRKKRGRKRGSKEERGGSKEKRGGIEEGSKQEKNKEGKGRKKRGRKGGSKEEREGRKGRSYILALSRLLFKAFSLRSCTRLESAFPRSKSFKALSRLNVGLGLVSMIHIAPI